MRLAIMQPYIFPYIGYYQLINLVDRFVIYDDVNFINKGWINRNNFLSGNKSFLFTIPLKEASQNRLIKDIELIREDGWRKKLQKTIEQSYRKAPYFNDVFPLITEVISADTVYIRELTLNSLRSIAGYLNMSTEFIVTSDIYNNKHLKGQERILDICLQEKADHYINPVGGMEIYSRELFEGSGIKLNFLQAKARSYRQFSAEFTPYLSMIDVLMFNSKENISDMLKSYELL